MVEKKDKRKHQKFEHEQTQNGAQIIIWMEAPNVELLLGAGNVICAFEARRMAPISIEIKRYEITGTSGTLRWGNNMSVTLESSGEALTNTAVRVHRAAIVYAKFYGDNNSRIHTLTGWHATRVGVKEGLGHDAPYLDDYALLHAFKDSMCMLSTNNFTRITSDYQLFLAETMGEGGKKWDLVLGHAVCDEIDKLAMRQQMLQREQVHIVPLMFYWALFVGFAMNQATVINHNFKLEFRTADLLSFVQWPAHITKEVAATYRPYIRLPEWTNEEVLGTWVSTSIVAGDGYYRDSKLHSRPVVADQQNIILGMTLLTTIIHMRKNEAIELAGSSYTQFLPMCFQEYKEYDSHSAGAGQNITWDITNRSIAASLSLICRRQCTIEQGLLSDLTAGVDEDFPLLPNYIIDRLQIKVENNHFVDQTAQELHAWQFFTDPTHSKSHILTVHFEVFPGQPQVYGYMNLAGSNKVSLIFTFNTLAFCGPNTDKGIRVTLIIKAWSKVKTYMGSIHTHFNT